MDPVSEKLEKARQELLDLGLRNTLLNYRELKSRGVKVINEHPTEVFRVLVQEGKNITFVPAEDNDGDLLRDLYLDEEFGHVFTQHKDTQLQTPYRADILKSRLRNTSNTARTALEERAINILFLALGMLEWYED